MRWLILVILCSVGVNGFSQAQDVSLPELLAAARLQPGYELAQKRVANWEAAPFQLSLIEKLEFRTETESFDWRQQEYVVRMNPNSFGERKYRFSMIQSEMEMTEIQAQEELLKELYLRYVAAIDYWFLQRKLEWSKSLNPVLADLVQKESLELSIGKSTVKDLVDAEERLEELEYKQFLWEADLEKLKRELGVYTQKGTAQLRPWELPEVAQMGPVLQEAVLNVVNHPKVREQQIRLRMVGEEKEVEMADLWKPVSFVQARYRGQDREIFNEAFSISLGLRAPLKGSTQFDIKELELEQAEETDQLDELLWNLQREVQLEQMEWETLLKKWNFLKDQNSTWANRFSSEKVNLMAENDPASVLYLQRLEKERALDLLELEYELYQQYAEILYLTGGLVRLPLINYLSKGLESY